MAYFRPGKVFEETYKFAQCFGDKNDNVEINDADIISAIQFDRTGDFLASGDRAGRVVLFERNNNVPKMNRSVPHILSHEAEFDYLKSLEINERINRIAWCRRANDAHLLLTTNDKTVKLWKVKERSVQSVVENNRSLSQKLANTDVSIPICLPRTIKKSPPMISAVPRRIFPNAHTYHIHSISMSPDGEIFLSADDLRINIWDLNSNEQSFNIVDLKPTNIESLSEVITATQFHPVHDHLFAYSTSKANVRLGDMRMSALCDRHAKNTCKNSFFTDIVTSISDVKFSPDGRYFVTRDYLTMQVWDTHMEAQPIRIIPMHESAKPKLCDLYESDIIFDKFEASFSHDGTSVMSGSYSNYLRVTQLGGDGSQTAGPSEAIHADKSIFKKKLGKPKVPGLVLLDGPKDMKAEGGSSFLAAGGQELDFTKRIFSTSSHPRENTVAIASASNLFLFSQK